MGEPAPAKGERSVLPLEEHQRWSLDHYMRTVTARRSDGPRPCRNNPGWRSVLLSDAAVTMPRHAVIAVSLPVGPNTGSLAQGISVSSCEAPLRRCRAHPAAKGAQVPASAHPGQGGTAWHAPVPSCVPPRSHRGGTSFLSAAAPICRPFRTSSSRHACRRRLPVVCASLSTNSQEEVFITAISLFFSLNPPARSPHREYGRRLIRGNR